MRACVCRRSTICMWEREQPPGHYKHAGRQNATAGACRWWVTFRGVRYFEPLTILIESAVRATRSRPQMQRRKIADRLLGAAQRLRHLREMSGPQSTMASARLTQPCSRRRRRVRPQLRENKFDRPIASQGGPTRQLPKEGLSEGMLGQSRL